MKDWSAIIEANWDACVEAMKKAAHDVGDSDGQSALRIELGADGTVSAYWTSPEIISAEVRNGEAMLLWTYYGGEAWSEEWADEYDAAADLEFRQAQVA